MNGQTTARVRRVDELEAFALPYRQAGRTIVLCHGCFDVVHPGHLRYLQFAKAQGDVLVVSITADDAIEKADGTRPQVPQELRAECLTAIGIVDCVVIASWPTAEPVIRTLRPDIYVKGREYEHSKHPGFLAERELVESSGGRVLFSSGEIVFSSTSLLDGLTSPDLIDSESRFGYWLARSGIDQSDLIATVTNEFRGKRVIVVGDSIVDRYTFCDAHAVAGEAPILSVKPIDERDFVGGAAIIASHVRALGADAHLITGMSDDEPSAWLNSELSSQGIDLTTIKLQSALPLKQRFVIDSQKVLKVDRVTIRPLDSAGESQVLSVLEDLRSNADVIIFGDFGCGLISLGLLGRATPVVREHVQVLAGDISGQQRTLLGYQAFDLLTPNERELRGVMGDFDQSLPSLADNLMRRLRIRNLLVTMGARGAVLFRPREIQPNEWFSNRLWSDHLPARTRIAVDPLGAGDACLAATSLGLAAQLSGPAACCLGMAAAAVQASRVGNPALDRSHLVRAIEQFPDPPVDVRKDNRGIEIKHAIVSNQAVSELGQRSLR